MRILVSMSLAVVALFGCDQGKIVQPPEPDVPRFETLAVAPTSVVTLIGGVYVLSAVPLDQSGTPMTGLAAPTFSSSDSTIASVSADGTVIGVRAGQATITATLTAGGITRSGVCVVTVTAAPTSGPTVTTPNLTFSPATLTVSEGATVTWQFSGAIHNVTFSGTLPPGGNIPDQAPGSTVARTFPTAGTYAYECTRHSGMTGQVVVTGAAAPIFTTLKVTPAASSILIGATVQLSATPLDQTGTEMIGLPPPSYTSDAAPIASVSSTGLVSGVATGTATITASLAWGGTTKTATATVTVTSPQTSGTTVTTPNLTFSPETVTIAAGAAVTWQFSGATHNVTFNGAAPPEGDIPNQSPGSSVSRTFPAAGAYAYECTRHGGMTGRVIVTAGGSGAPIYTSLAVTPATGFVAVGGTLQLTVTAFDQYGTPMTGLPLPTFTTNNAAVASVNGTGVVTGIGAGSATITASLTAAGVTHTATAAITVTQLAGVIVTTTGNEFTPETVFLAPGGTVTWQFSGGTHNVTFERGASPPGGDIPDTPAGSSVSRTFPVAGDYDYVCTRHDGMKGRVRVR